jgi:hypothetical protein
MSRKIIFILSVASLFAAGSGFAATSSTTTNTKHHPHGYHAYGSNASNGHGYRSTCARFNAKLANEPGAIAIQDQDVANNIGGRKGTCH